MQVYLEYKDYLGSIHYDPLNNIYYGQIKFIEEIISYEGNTPLELQDAFYDAVDNYIDIFPTLI